MLYNNENGEKKLWCLLINYLPNTKASYYVEHLRLNLSQQLQLNTYQKVNIICRQTTKYTLRSIS